MAQLAASQARGQPASIEVPGGRRPRIQHEDRWYNADVRPLLKANGWWWQHVRPTWDSRREGAIKTPIDGVKGCLDLSPLMRPPMILHVELKWGDNKATPEQRGWIAGLRACGQRAYIWTPDTWREIVLWLTAPVNGPYPPVPEAWLRAA